MNREELIEAAAKAILRADNNFDFNEGQSEDAQWLRALARAALAVFEQAHTTSDDERAEWTATLEALLAKVYTILKPLAEGGTHSTSSPILKAYELLNAQEFTGRTALGTPTDDEREALANLIRRDFYRVDGLPDDEDRAIADVVLEAGFRRTVHGEPTATCPKCGTTVTDQTPSTFYTSHDETCGGALEEPQGEPSGPQVNIPEHLSKRDELGPAVRKFLVEEARAENDKRRADEARRLRAAAATQEGDNRG